MGLPTRDASMQCSLPSLRYMAVSIGCVNKVHPPFRVVCMTCVHDMCESGRGVVRGSVSVCMGGVRACVCACVCVLGGGPRVVHACGCVHAIFEGLQPCVYYVYVSVRVSMCAYLHD